MAKRVLGLFGVEDAKIRQVLTDEPGGSPTFGAAIDVPGITRGVITGDVSRVSLKGDNRTLESQTVIGDLTCTFDHARLSLDVLEVMLGGASVATGTTPATVETFTYSAGDVFGDFVLEFRTPQMSDGTDVHMRTAKLKLAAFPELGLVGEEYRTVDGLECSLVPMEGADGYFSIISNETATDISATFLPPA